MNFFMDPEEFEELLSCLGKDYEEPKVKVVKREKSTALDRRGELVEELVYVLEELAQCTPPPKHSWGRGQCYYCENIFEAIYQLYLEEMDIELQEQKKIAKLVISVFPHLAEGVQELSNLSHQFGGHILRVRSGAQFFVDKFKDFYYETDKTLEEFLKGLQRDLDDWDEELLDWKENNFYVEYSFFKLDEFKRPAAVPPTHLWWED